jgi:hypothetical protein
LNSKNINKNTALDNETDSEYEERKDNELPGSK